MSELLKVNPQPLQVGDNEGGLLGRTLAWYKYKVSGQTHRGQELLLRFDFYNNRAGAFMDCCHFAIHRCQQIDNLPQGDPYPATLGAGSETGQPGLYFDNPDAPVGEKIWRGVLERGLEIYIRVFNVSDIHFGYNLNLTVLNDNL